MRQKLVSARTLLFLVAVALVLPIGICLVLGLGRLLGAMDDQGEIVAFALDWIGGTLGILWVLDMICLVLAQALNNLVDLDESAQDAVVRPGDEKIEE